MNKIFSGIVLLLILVPLNVRAAWGRSYIDPVVHFKKNKTALINKTSYLILDDTISILKANPAQKFWILGYASADEKKPPELSLKRAEKMAAYFIENGINPNRFEIKAYGAERPVATDQTEEGRAMNRRVDFRAVE